MKKKILLIEPNYKNKYPPLGLMKISTYHKRKGDSVSFFKGELNDLVLDELLRETILKLNKLDKNICWVDYSHDILQFIKTGNINHLENILSQPTKYTISAKSWLIHYKDIFKKKQYDLWPKWDRIYITTLFTFYFKLTIETINHAKFLTKSLDNIFIGGVLASVLPDQILLNTGIQPHIGLLDKPGVLGDDDIIVDHLPLDYSILHEIDYEYPASNAIYGYTTRGCIRKCSFCAVPVIEPKYKSFISIKDQVLHAQEIFGDKKNLLLMDNNVLASKRFPKIIEDIIASGFGKNTNYYSPNYLYLFERNLRSDINDKGYIKALQKLYLDTLSKAKDADRHILYKILKDNNLLKIETSTKKAILRVYNDVKPIYDKSLSKSPSKKTVDFNQGVDARLITKENAELLSKIAIKPLRIAFDSINYKDTYINAVTLCASEGIKNLSNYLLYNEKDKPEDLYNRIKINIDLSEKLDVNIYSFPMKFHPIFGDTNLNRDYIGENWSRKYIRAIQLVLNATKGKIGRRRDFFEKAFGANEEEFKIILHMPEIYILYRFFFEKIGYTDKWKTQYLKLTEAERVRILPIILRDRFPKDVIDSIKEPHLRSFLNHYLIPNDSFSNPKNPLFQLKAEFDRTGLVKSVS